MKKLIGLFAIAGMVFLSCGPSAEEQAAEQKRIDDSIALAKAQADSIAAAEAAVAAEQQRVQDSIANAQRIADSIAAAKPAKGGKAKAAPKAEVKKQEPAAPATPEKKASRMQGAKKTN